MLQVLLQLAGILEWHVIDRLSVASDKGRGQMLICALSCQYRRHLGSAYCVAYQWLSN